MPVIASAHQKTAIDVTSIRALLGVVWGRAQEREHLPEALESRRIIEEALGIVMERCAMDEDRAFVVRDSPTSG